MGKPPDVFMEPDSPTYFFYRLAKSIFSPQILHIFPPIRKTPSPSLPHPNPNFNPNHPPKRRCGKALKAKAGEGHNSFASSTQPPLAARRVLPKRRKLHEDKENSTLNERTKKF
ncbi:hypothetical protein Syun_003914 [Stephania yunnanensis]|uniref:Uncharacterized protein n=1 Tax=Stephania yunnanensis TaxID=152371 RepID=A0AAP0Q097_9MAGN